MRKDLDLDLEEEIRVELDVSDDRVAELIRRHDTLITDEVRATAFDDVSDGHRKEWDIEGVSIDIAIAPLDAPEQSD